MARKNARNNELLSSARPNVHTKVYTLMLELVNEDRQDLAEAVFKIDNLLHLSIACIRDRSFNEAKLALSNAKNRMDGIKQEGVDTEYFEEIYEGLIKGIKK